MSAEDRPWHLARAGDVAGPLSTDDLLLAIRAGRVPPDALAWREGMDRWRGVAEIPELRPALRARGFDGLPRRKLVSLAILAVASGLLVLVANSLRALSGQEVSPAWSGLSGALLAPGAFLIWKALRRRT